MEEDFSLTDEQVETWRTLLINMPLPPFYMSIGAYALIAPRKQIVQIVKILNEKLNQEVEEAVGRPMKWIEPKPIQSDNLIRTRPRKNTRTR